MRSPISNAWMQAHQIALYLGAIGCGVVIGLAVPASKDLLGVSVNPFLGLLLYATFLSMPLTKVFGAFRDVRFMMTLVVVNFLVVPAVAFGLSRFVIADQALLFGILLVLLAPCVDYVIVFTGLAGGASQKLLAATPMLLALQVMLIPLFLYLFAGPDTLGLIEAGPFVVSLVALIIIPFIVALATQRLAVRNSRAKLLMQWNDSAMVPLMMATLLCVVGSQIDNVTSSLGELVLALIIFSSYVVVMGLLGFGAGKLFRLEVPDLRAATFSGVTRNSLVVLPIALALPAEFSLASTVVVAQTLIELLAMLFLVATVPKLIPTETV